jgi:hypothetical protein
MAKQKSIKKVSAHVPCFSGIPVLEMVLGRWE